jgi:hypothetical protein
MATPECKQNHENEYTDEHLFLVELAHSYEVCGSIARLVTNDYKTGWELHRKAQLIVNSLPCECELHTHDDNLSFNAYTFVSEFLATDKDIPDEMFAYCDTIE